ncbi:Ras guanine nucleotide exchange factor A [Thecamonas trahens ATCC 50062]|uniref:Ras guanine nucleotide exchange factor A n=1 Tax=Thecamonas trahens ATCC 50062 TaxID=461836 RepID=A0A0L0DAV4_THETB|nr:Ras guanine nucleotide exchange factor A [Thecamonas trahens ATCC 50062]KNC49216.1 Ras guanine nucleotide exchange factor A [Thecamonas trahens ATCC 50062]|eukprot:XP_013757936.1 Ras guanine nucleotide exchange factor A [Thecamonas trahens ATCC 50062]
MAAVEESSMKELREENARLQAELSSVQASFTQSKVQLRTRIQAIVDDYKESKAKAEALRSANEALLLQLEERDEARFSTIPVQNEEHLQLMRTLVSTQRVVVLEKVAAKLAITRKTSSLEEAKAKVAELEAEVEANVAEKTTLVDTALQLEADAEALRDSYAAAAASVENAKMWERQNKHVQTALEATQTRVVELKASRNATQTAIAELAEQREAASTRYAELMATKSSLVQQVRALTEANRASAAWHRQNDMLRSHKAWLERGLAQVEAFVADAEVATPAAGGGVPLRRGDAEAAVLTEQDAALQAGITELRAEVASVKAETERLLSQDYQHLTVTPEDVLSIVQARLTIARLEASADVAAQRLAKLRAKVAALEPDLEALVPRASGVQAALARTHQLLESHAELLVSRRKLLAAREDALARLREYGPDLEVESLGAGDKASDGGVVSWPTDGRKTVRLVEVPEVEPQLSPLPLAEVQRERAEAAVANAANETGLVDAMEARIKSEIMLLMVEREQGRARLTMSLLRSEDGTGGAGFSSAAMLATLLAEHTTVADSPFIKFMPDTLTSPEPKIKAATLPHLVQHLTFPTYPATEFVHEFLLTYRSVAEPEDVMSLILERFCISCPVKLEPEHEAEFQAKVVRPIRLRVINFLRIWVSTYVQDFAEAPVAGQLLRGFMESILKVHVPSQHKLFLSVLRKFKSSSKKQRRLASLNVVATLPKLTKRSGVVKSFDKADVRKLAACINSYEFGVFEAIQPRECFGLAWSKDGREQSSPNVLALVQRFNKMSTWVAATILEAGDGEKSASKAASARARAIKKMVNLAHELYERHNFNATMGILAGLSSNAIYRLQVTWAKVDNKTHNKREGLVDVFSSAKSWKALRERIHAVNPPVIPYLGMYLTDLTFTEDGNPSTIDGLINFTKCRRYAAILREIQRYQDIGYDDVVVEMSHHMWLQKDIERAVQTYPDADEELYQKSLKVEPRT